MKKEKKEKSEFEKKIVDNIRNIMIKKKVTQATFAGYMGISESQFSKILQGTHGLSFLYLEKLARSLSMSEIEIITYPHIYVEQGKSESEPVEAVLQIKLKKEKKDQVLKLVFGDNNIEILNK